MCVCARASPVGFHPVFSASARPERYRTFPYAGVSFPQGYAEGRKENLQEQSDGLHRGCFRCLEEAKSRNALRVALGRRAAVCWGNGAQRPAPRGAALRACRRGRARGAQLVLSFSRNDKGSAYKCGSCSKVCSEAAAVHQSKHFSHCLVKITGVKLWMPQCLIFKLHLENVKALLKIEAA